MEDILQKIFKKVVNARDLIGDIEDTRTEDNLKKLHKAYEQLWKITAIIENYKESGKNGSKRSD